MKYALNIEAAIQMGQNLADEGISRAEAAARIVAAGYGQITLARALGAFDRRAK